MKLSYNWIKDYTDIKASAEELAERLTMTGSEVGSVEKTGGDVVMDLEITSNRPDCLNMVGLAREAAAVYGTELKVPREPITATGKADNSNTIECEIKDLSLCPRYTARRIGNVKIKEVSVKIASRLDAVGIRKVNNVVDITNFCLIETGQPMHAFDLDKIKGGKIEVRPAVKGEKLVTIDGLERELEAGMLVIADKQGPVAIAGIMGGKNTEVTGQTKNILLESAYFDPVSVRRTSRALGLVSDSSYRFERGVDKGALIWASERATNLILRETGGEQSFFYDCGILEEKKQKIKLDIDRASDILGIKLEEEEVLRILQALGMEATSEKDHILSVMTPSFREDVSREIDLIEEIARIHGFDKIPETVPRPAPWSPRKTKKRQVLEKLKKLLCSMGLSEIMTYSLVNSEAVSSFKAFSKDVVAIKKALSAEHEILTPHLIDGMLRTIGWNINRGSKDLMFFETGKVYRRVKQEKRFEEIPALCIGLSGNLSKNWLEKEKISDFYALKGLLERAADSLRFSFDVKPSFIDGLMNAGSIYINDIERGFMGEVLPRGLERFGISQKVYVAQILLDEIMKRSVLLGRYSPIPRFPFSSRDLSILCGKTLSAAEIKKEISNLGGDLIRKIEVLDMYEGKQVPESKKSITFSLVYGDPQKTLTDSEIQQTHSKIKQGLVSVFGISFR